MNTWQSLIRTGTAIALAACLALGVACAQSAPPGPKQIPSGPAAAPEVSVPVVLKVKTDKKLYRTKEPVKMTLTAKNTGKSKVSLNFSSGQRYDFVISRGKGASMQTVWKWSQNRMFPMMIDTVSLEAGKSLTFTETCAPGEKGADGKPIPEMSPGTYTVSAILTTMGRTPRPMTSTTIQIK